MRQDREPTSNARFGRTQSRGLLKARPCARTRLIAWGICSLSHRATRRAALRAQPIARGAVGVAASERAATRAQRAWRARSLTGALELQQPNSCLCLGRQGDQQVTCGVGVFFAARNGRAAAQGACAWFMRSGFGERSRYLQLAYPTGSDTGSASLSNFPIEGVRPPD